MIREKKWTKEAEARAAHDERSGKRDPGADFKIRSLEQRARIKATIENLIIDKQYADVERICLFVEKLKAESAQRGEATK